jgi:hypothetical protein
MIILDTHHLSILEYPERPQYQTLVAAMDRSVDTDFVTSAITVEEQLRAWLPAIHRTRRVHDQILYYTRFTGLIEFFSVGGHCCRSMSPPLTDLKRCERTAFASVRWT